MKNKKSLFNLEYDMIAFGMILLGVIFGLGVLLTSISNLWGN